MTNAKYTSQQVGAYYNQMAEYYRLAWGGNLHVGYWPEDDPDASFEQAQNNLSDLMIAQTPVHAEHVVLDVGCGYGRPGTRLAVHTGCRVVGITISEVQAEEANRHAAAQQVAERARFQCMDAMALSFAEASFDAAWAFECLFHMPDRAQVLREMARVVRPGARLVLTDSCEGQLLSELETQLVYAGFQVNSFITPEQYAELLPTLGFDVLDIRDLSTHTGPTVTHVMAAAEAKSEQLRAIYGDAFVDEMLEAGPYLDAISREKIRYFMVVAERA